MKIDSRTLENGTIAETDLCIIGTGAAGITIAKTLAKTKTRILVLESGDFSIEENTQALYEGRNSGLPYFQLHNARLRYFGGSTGHWGGWCAPLEAVDFEKRDWIPHSGWPIQYSDMLPWFKKAQEVCQLGPFEYGPEYWEKQNPAFKRMPLDPKKVDTKLLQFSPPVRFGQTYRNDLTNSPNITLWTNANVTEIQAAPAGNHVSKVKVQTLTGKTHTVQAKQFVLACGGLENPRILLNSRNVMSTGLGNSKGLVGRYFMEHPHVVSAFMVLGENSAMDFYRFYAYKSKAMALLGIPPQLQKKHQIANYSAVLQERSIGYVDQHEQGFRDAVQSLRSLERWESSRDSDDYPDWYRAQTWGLSTRIEQVPNPDSRITLQEDKDELGQAKIDLKWQMSELDKKTIREAQQIIGNELGRSQIGRLQIPDWVMEDNNQWPDFLVGGWHHMGTTRMSDHPNQGVVDAQCRVHGVDNLYIGGSSVFTTSGTANPTLTIVALSLRLAEHLKSQFS